MFNYFILGIARIVKTGKVIGQQRGFKNLHGKSNKPRAACNPLALVQQNETQLKLS